MPTERIAACVEYDGTAYNGWQRQPHAPSVQARVESALSRVADHPVAVVCGGRTDAGVHALGQVVHFDSQARRPDHAWVFGANSNLPSDISLRWARPVPPDFHARYTAVAREYRYLILDHPARSALLGRRAAHSRHRLDAAAMHEAAQALLGERDFSAFRAAGCQSNTPMRRVERVRVRRSGDLVIMDIRANAFVHHMVRNIAGSLMVVGRGLQPSAWIAELQASRDRRLGGATAPAHGLYFRHIEYPPAYDLPEDTAPPAGAPAVIE
ncbi:tRNA pseudouridine synthase A [Salinisphaera sp. PC39]|uniref:tRNA pseudouridine(38-40) synthase TruA n=1 Tax=Salinisphaera sp. PC39 TaxID=1304156 RepID=UPI0033406ABC